MQKVIQEQGRKIQEQGRKIQELEQENERLESLGADFRSCACSPQVLPALGIDLDMGGGAAGPDQRHNFFEISQDSHKETGLKKNASPVQNRRVHQKL